MPRLESAIKEALRLHPPLILVLRVAKEELEIEGFRISPGKLVGPAWPYRTGSRGLPDADAFVPDATWNRARGPAEPVTWIPSVPDDTVAWGAVRHDAVEGHLLGAPAGWEFELAQPSHTYVNDHSKMVVQLQQPCAVHYVGGAPDRRGPRREDRRRPRSVPGHGCASRRRRTSSPCRRKESSPSSMRTRPRSCVRRSNKLWPSVHEGIENRETETCVIRTRAPADGRPVARRQQRAPGCR